MPRDQRQAFTHEHMGIVSATTGKFGSTEWIFSSTMSRRKKRNRGGNPALHQPTKATKRYSPFITYLRSLTFLKNTFFGCIYPGMTAVDFHQHHRPGWWYLFLIIPVILFPFAIVAIERIGFFIAPAAFWRRFHSLDSRNQNSILVLYHLLISLLVLPLALIYVIQLFTSKQRTDT